MRLDLFFKTSRLIARRSLAQEFCDNGLITVNGAPAKSSKEVKVDDVIEIKRRSALTTVLVLEIPTAKQVSRNAAGGLYRVINETILEDDMLSSGSR